MLLSPATSAQAQTRDVEVADNSFAPREITRTAGASVTWLWTGTNPHTVTSTDGRFASSAQKQGVGNTHSARFTQAGSYPYFCSVHGTAMSGTITINAAPAPSASPTPAPRPTPAPTSAQPTPAPSRTQAPRSTAPSPAATSARPSPSLASPSPPAVVASGSPSPSPTSVARTALLEPSVAPTPSRVPSSAPLATLDEPLPKDRSGLAIGLGLVVAAVGLGTAGALLLRRRRTDSP